MDKQEFPGGFTSVDALFDAFFIPQSCRITVKPPLPAKPHPLQKMSSTPNGWGQSMWRPWE